MPYMAPHTYCLGQPNICFQYVHIIISRPLFGFAPGIMWARALPKWSSVIPVPQKMCILIFIYYIYCIYNNNPLIIQIPNLTSICILLTLSIFYAINNDKVNDFCFEA
jgi:hypothetical protein